MLLTTTGIAAHVSGVILFDETLRQHATDGRRFADLVSDAGMVPGIKVDAGTRPMAGFPGEVVTEGLDGLRERFAEYVGLGARFAKWRAVIRIDDGLPTRACIDSHAHGLARYAALAQEAGLTPIIEPEVLMDGTHSLARCAEVTAEVLRSVYVSAADLRVVLEGTLLKPNMVVPGAAAPGSADDDEIARTTVEVMRRSVPAAVPGIVFLSGGMTARQATARLNAINAIALASPQPWELSFSFGRALQEPVLRAWAGDDRHRDEAQAALRHRAALNGAARHGTYQPALEDLLPA
jgi:fructose-bisphosphate aldolase class I